MSKSSAEGTSLVDECRGAWPDFVCFVLAAFAEECCDDDGDSDDDAAESSDCELSSSVDDTRPFSSLSACLAEERLLAALSESNRPFSSVKAL